MNNVSGWQKRDAIWSCYSELSCVTGKTGRRAKCKDCGSEMQGLVARMKKHRQKCPGGEDQQIPDCDSDAVLTRQLQEKGQPAFFRHVTTSSDAVTDMQTSTSGSFYSRKATATINVKPETCVELLTKPSSSKVRSLASFVTKTIKSDMEILGEQIATFIYATNSLSM